jgi:hypothetical protein
MSGDHARSLRAKFKAFDAACAAAQSPASTTTREALLRGVETPAPSVEESRRVYAQAFAVEAIDPSALQKFHAAVLGAWQLVVAQEPSNTGCRQDVIDTLAVGVLRAASKGERDTRRLSAAACRYFIARRK